MKHCTAWLAIFLVCILVVSGCSRVNLPNVDPPATPVVDPSPSLEATDSTRAPRTSTSVISSHQPWATPTMSAQIPEDDGMSASGSISGTSVPSPFETSGQLEGRSTEASSSDVPWIADAMGSVPSIQPVRMRGVWVATVLNIDFPKAMDDATAQKEECLKILDNAKSWGMDTVIFQARPMGDALYASSINPWSHFLTGTQGKDPGWDPLRFMIDEAHKRGLSLHVWLNPYRAVHFSVDMEPEDLAPGSFAAQHPEWLIEFENGWYYDPAVPEVRQHIADTVKEIVDNYEVDGIHFDDYFYPSGYPLPPGAERDGILDRERRENVNEMIRMVHDVIKAKNPRILFGISPFGIWKNDSSDPEGSSTKGSESYYAQAADSLAWVREGIIDYLAPQLYWTIGYEAADYEKLVAWWSDKMRGTGVSLLIGQGIYRDEVAGEIERQLAINAAHPEVTGSIYFSYQDLEKNPACVEAIRKSSSSN